MFVRWIFFLLGSLLFCRSAESQSLSSQLKKAQDFFEMENYVQASVFYKNAWEKTIQNNNDLLHAGMAFYESNELEKAQQSFEILLERSIKNKKICHWYLARIYQFQSDFRKALTHYKSYLKTLGKKEDSKIPFIKNEMIRCTNGVRLKRLDPNSIVEPIGGNINSVQDEFACIPSVHHRGRYYFSAVRIENTGGKRDENGLNDTDGSYRSDLFIINQQEGKWFGPLSFSSLINSSKHDILLDFALEGKALLYFQSWNEWEGIIYTDTFSENKIKIENSIFESPMLPQIGDNSMSLFQDSILIFSSRRNGGFGGYDLYISVKRNSVWSPALNLGPQINSPFNELYPFIALDGLTLYFSSDNLSSIGGFDVFQSQYKPESGRWDLPVNIGIPINSAGNESYFRLTADGLAGIFSSDRKIDCKGKRDIFMAYFKDELEEQLYASKGSLLSNIIYPATDFTDRKPSTSVKVTTVHEAYKDYYIEPLYYKGEEFLQDPKNMRILDMISKMMQIHPDLTLQIIGHAYEEAQTPINLYYSIKKAEQVAEYIIEKNIPKHRITLCGTGSSIPQAIDPLQGMRSLSAEKWNKRIEFNFYKTDTSLARISYSVPQIIEALKSENNKTFRQLQEKITYSLFIGESQQILNHPFMNTDGALLFVKKNNEYRKLSILLRNLQ